jgi:hypothetical protein
VKDKILGHRIPMTIAISAVVFVIGVIYFVPHMNDRTGGPLVGIAVGMAMILSTVTIALALVLNRHQTRLDEMAREVERLKREAEMPRPHQPQGA